MLSNFLRDDLIIINPKVLTKEELFEKMVNLLYNKDLVLNKKDFLDALMKREKVSSTEIYPGIALPHARSKYIEKLLVSIVISRKGIDYCTPGMGPVNIAFFFGASEKHNKEYLQVLAQSARLLKNKEFTKKVVECSEPAEVIKLIGKYHVPNGVSEEKKYYSLIITLYEPRKLNDVLTSMVELGITNGTIVDCNSLAKKIAFDMPIFAGLSYLGIGKTKHANMIFSVIQERKTISKLIDLLKDNGVDFNKSGIGFVQLVKIDQLFGKIDEKIEL